MGLLQAGFIQGTYVDLQARSAPWMEVIVFPRHTLDASHPPHNFIGVLFIIASFDPDLLS